MSSAAYLARAEQFGAVTRCLHGCVHVQVGHAAWSFTEEQYFRFVALVNESASNYELHFGGAFDRAPEADAGSEER